MRDPLSGMDPTVDPHRLLVRPVIQRQLAKDTRNMWSVVVHYVFLSSLQCVWRMYLQDIEWSLLTRGANENDFDCSGVVQLGPVYPVIDLQWSNQTFQCNLIPCEA